jgi:hypothetical protein
MKMEVRKCVSTYDFMVCKSFKKASPKSMRGFCSSPIFSKHWRKKREEEEEEEEKVRGKGGEGG